MTASTLTGCTGLPRLDRRQLVTGSSAAIAACALAAAVPFKPTAPSFPPAALPLAYEHVFNDVIDICAKHFGTTGEVVLSPSRERREVYARQSAMFIARRLTGTSYPEIGRRFGGRDHTTVLHADRKISALIQYEPTWRWTIERLTERVLRVARARLADAGAGRITG